MVKTAAKSSKKAKKTEPATHEDICEHHKDPRDGLCTALTRAGTKCTFRATSTDARYLPTCRIHQHVLLDAGKCQAIAECGQVCNIVTRYDKPYHFCAKHEKGTETLLCHFMRLSTELRFMIYRYVFSESIPSSNPYDNARIHNTNVAILRVNQEISLEASSVLYGELTFHARVTPTTITVLGKTWHRSRFGSVERSDPLDINQALCMKATKRIRNLVVDVNFGKWRAELRNRRSHLLGGVVRHGITNELYDLYEVRDSVRKLVELFPASEGKPSLKRLTVQTKMGNEYGWSPAEKVAAMFFVLEPFQYLHVPLQTVLEIPQPAIVDHAVKLDYEKLREEWITAVKASTPRTSANGTVARLAYRKIEDFVQVIKEEELQHYKSLSNGKRILSRYPIFNGIERPLHLARVACGNEDPSMLEQVRKAITDRWAIFQRQERRAANVISTAIKNMVVSTSKKGCNIRARRLSQCVITTIPGEEYPDVIQDATVEDVLGEWRPDHRWTELPDGTPPPKRGDPGVTIKEDSLRVYYHQDDKTWIRLKTPAMVRMKRVEEQLS
jgi:hypothetical protein